MPHVGNDMNAGGVLTDEPMTMPSTAKPQPHPMRRFAQHLLRGVVLPQDTRFGAALRTAGGVVPVLITEANAYGLTLDARLPALPTERCVLTIMVDAVARIDLPVRLSRTSEGYLAAKIEGVPLVLRRRVTLNAQLTATLAA